MPLGFATARRRQPCGFPSPLSGLHATGTQSAISTAVTVTHPGRQLRPDRRFSGQHRQEGIRRSDSIRYGLKEETLRHIRRKTEPESRGSC